MAEIIPDGFESQRELKSRTGDGLDMVSLTGYVLFGMRGGQNGGWNRQDLVFTIGPRWDAVRDTVAAVSPSSMYNKNTAINAGWAVDRVDVSYFQQIPGPPGVQVRLTCGLAVSDTDGILYRVSYHVTTIGRLAEPGRFPDLVVASELVAASGQSAVA